MTVKQKLICNSVNGLLDDDKSLESAIEITKDILGVSHDAVIDALQVESIEKQKDAK